MIMPSDKEYKVTKQIMLGRATINPDFIELANFIDQTFDVKTVNIFYDTIDKGKRPRLNICFEFEREKQIFNEKGGHVNLDSEKQKIIADKFSQTLKEQKIIRRKGLFDVFTKSKKEKFRPDNVCVYYSAFEPIARIEANENVPKEKIAQLKKGLNSKDLWEISRCFSGTTFFLYTDHQMKQFENSDVRKLWADKYFDLLEPYNEFGYLKREKFNINLDSKENFDNNYESNWYYYYK
ncbi:hypothetical protein [Sphingobacterium gobiense]|uniref:Uncharacterized protein n=1 Tax=Sphingobacterium gobiense TaxID=1382456 RepID=A0A2S9JNI9_9SPHI|nr:hypothetical protein [Sphingobacterium gobiense]PRD54691.1 hypothetical protein C5749_14760 [Sphingobacterium gobiense]